MQDLRLERHNEHSYEAYLFSLLSVVGAPVSVRSLEERLRADTGALAAPPEAVPLRAFLERCPRFAVRAAPWSPKAALVELAVPAATRAALPGSCREAAERFESQLLAYLETWKSATAGTLALENPLPPVLQPFEVSTAGAQGARAHGRADRSIPA